ncbi:MAG: hypothetical protein JXR31_17055 [Prolixibacteraceae bacterium]|nr:hypothetical protein [Prolixibacteraceae bacterium]MBN2775967.1 hypothetical protein [Prolixibacteraceae bacterium]
MKKLNLVTLMVALVLFVSVTVNATGSRKEFIDYQINQVEDLFLGKKAEKVWTLTYSVNETPVTVVKTKNLDGTNYVVHSKYFEVNYLAGPKGFGAVELKKGWSNVPKKISRAVISQDELKRQQIITPNPVDDEKALGLIASYLPMLINDGYTHLLN